MINSESNDKVSVEYLIKWNNDMYDLSEKKDLIKILTIINKIKVINDCIYYEEKYIECDFTSVKKNFIVIKFSIDIDSISYLERFSKDYRKIMFKFIDVKEMEVTWDGISTHYAVQAYPLINVIENKMRGLINKFMTINSGLDWSLICAPKSVKDSVRMKEDSNRPYLHSLDFIKLVEFLLNEYSFKSSEDLANFINKLDSEKEVSKKDFMDYLKISNWDRYFKEYLVINSSELNKMWKELYRYRCHIAHNRSFSKMDVEQVEFLFNKVSNIIEEASRKLIQINLSQYEKDNLLVTSRKISIEGYGGYELECGINKVEKTIYIKNLMNKKMVSGSYILLEEGIDLVDADNLHVRCDDKEFGCFGGAIYEVHDNPAWYPGISINELYESSYEFLHRIIRFKHGDLEEEELFNVSQEWIDNPNT